MTQQLEFRRLVLGSPYRIPGHSMRLATELAEVLRLDLFALFVEEESVRNLAGLPFTREFRPLGGGWRPLDVDQLTRDLEIAGRNAEKAFREAVKNLQTPCRFEIVRGSTTEIIASISRRTDILLIPEPEGAADRVTAQFAATLEAALRSAAAVLLVPSRIARRSGAIVALATEPNDPSIAAAKVLAGAAGEELVVIEGRKAMPDRFVGRSSEKSAAQFGGIRAASRSLADVTEIGGLEQMSERLIVASRKSDLHPLAIASVRRVPVLIVEPPLEKA